MTGKIRVGIVGATVTPGGSGWGANAHVPALRSLPESSSRPYAQRMRTQREHRKQLSAPSWLSMTSMKWSLIRTST